MSLDEQLRRVGIDPDYAERMLGIKVVDFGVKETAAKVKRVVLEGQVIEIDALDAEYLGL